MAIKKTSTKNKIKYEVLEECGTISKRGDYDLKLRWLAWNGKEPKYDLRPWKIDEDGDEVCGKGITLSGEELEDLGKLIAEMMEEG